MHWPHRVARPTLLTGAAAAVMLGGAAFVCSFEPSASGPAYADAVQVPDATTAPPSFADVAQQVSRAVVIIRVQASITDASSPDNFFGQGKLASETARSVVRSEIHL